MRYLRTGTVHVLQPFIDPMKPKPVEPGLTVFIHLVTFNSDPAIMS